MRSPSGLKTVVTCGDCCGGGGAGCCEESGGRCGWPREGERFRRVMTFAYDLEFNSSDGSASLAASHLFSDTIINPQCQGSIVQVDEFDPDCPGGVASPIRVDAFGQYFLREAQSIGFPCCSFGQCFNCPRFLIPVGYDPNNCTLRSVIGPALIVRTDIRVGRCDDGTSLRGFGIGLDAGYSLLTNASYMRFLTGGGGFYCSGSRWRWDVGGSVTPQISCDSRCLKGIRFDVDVLGTNLDGSPDRPTFISWQGNMTFSLDSLACCVGGATAPSLPARATALEELRRSGVLS